MKTITMTIEQYNAIRRLKDFAQWYIEEHEGGSFISDDQWKEDRDDVARGAKRLCERVGKDGHEGIDPARFGTD